MSYENILLEIKDGVGWLTLNRPKSLNALNKTTGDELLHALETVRDDETVRAVVLTGAGRAFSSGGDVKEMTLAGSSLSEQFFEELIGNLNRSITLITDLPKPVLAAINGPAAGIGFNFALAADIRIAARSATFTQAFVHIGLVPDGGGSYFLPRLVGWGIATEMILTGRLLSAEEAHQVGIVSQVVEDAEFAATVQQWASRLAAGPTSAMARAKQLLKQSQTNTLAEQLRAEQQTQMLCGRSHDFREGITAFVEKRKPNFTGK